MEYFGEVHQDYTFVTTLYNFPFNLLLYFPFTLIQIIFLFFYFPSVIPYFLNPVRRVYPIQDLSTYGTIPSDGNPAGLYKHVP